MPCFRGLAISIHTPDGALPEYSIQKQTRRSRITSYIPVPPAKVRPDAPSAIPEQSTFAISITLLTPGLPIPYTTNPSTSRDTSPKPQIVGEPTGQTEREPVKPYAPVSASPNETVAAYIYFDGRSKEEVATLLRRGEETWVNSRWVSVPESEGGGLAEREFLFREVGLERWLNGLDLEGKDAAAKIERRRERMERRRRWRRSGNSDKRSLGGMDMDRGDDEEEVDISRDKLDKPESHSDDNEMLYSSDSESEPPVPEAAGQIKIALFRVIASGEIKRGEYSPQFDAHDDDDEPEPGQPHQSGTTNGGHIEQAEIDHTTSFAKPKILDPKSISTQTVTGIDPPDRPYATFTFLYRSERQLQKMGILPGPKSDEKLLLTPNKRRSVQTDFSKLPPLKGGGAVGFSTFRDTNSMSPTGGQSTKGKKREPGNYESDDDDGEEIDVVDKVDEGEDESKAEGVKMLSAEDAERQGELAEGVRKIKLKRAHSAEPLEGSAPRKSTASNPPTATHTPQPTNSIDTAATPPTSHNNHNPSLTTGDIQSSNEAMIGSPMKRSRPSLADSDDNPIRRRLGLGLLGGSGNGNEDNFPHTLFAEDTLPSSSSQQQHPKKNEDEDL